MGAYSVIVTDKSVVLMGPSGTQSTLAFPSGVAATGKKGRSAILAGHVVVVGATSEPLWIAPDLSLRQLAMPTPNAASVLAAGAAGGYTGTRKLRVSFLLRDTASGKVLAEGPLGPESNSVAFVAQKINITALPLPASNQPANARRLYFTTASGSTYFAAMDVDDATTTSLTVTFPDAALSAVSAPTDLIACPKDIDLITVWKNRLWGRSKKDVCAGTSAGIVTRWPNAFTVDPKGNDSTGINGYLPRRDSLGILRRDRVWKLVGDSEADFALVKVVDGKGCVSPDTCKVIRDVGYFLSDDGVYTWTEEGINSITDSTVRPWFTTDTYFNRAKFSSAFFDYDPVRHRLLCFLPAAGSTVNNRWVEYDITSGKWFGIHLCAAVTNFTASAIAPDSNGVLRLVIGANDGYLYAFTPDVWHDGPATPIEFDVFGAHHTPDPDRENVFLQPTIINQAETGGFLNVTPYLGDAAATAGVTMTCPLSVERTRLARIGNGRMCALRFSENTIDQPVRLYGYILPTITLGRR